jgi:hypothetical protein
MASLIRKAIQLSRSPQGKRLIGEVGKVARDPKNKQRIAQVRKRFSK